MLLLDDQKPEAQRSLRTIINKNAEDKLSCSALYLEL